jgi:hypothetical protein
MLMLSHGLKDRLTQLATGVARTADVFTLADHTFRPGEIIQAFLPDGSVSRQGRISATSTFLAVCSRMDGFGQAGICFADMSNSKGSAGCRNRILNTNTRLVVLSKELMRIEQT